MTESGHAVCGQGAVWTMLGRRRLQSGDRVPKKPQTELRLKRRKLSRKGQEGKWPNRVGAVGKAMGRDGAGVSGYFCLCTITITNLL